jgi:hypothetical protein
MSSSTFFDSTFFADPLPLYDEDRLFELKHWMKDAIFLLEGAGDMFESQDPRIQKEEYYKCDFDPTPIAPIGVSVVDKVNLLDTFLIGDVGLRQTLRPLLLSTVKDDIYSLLDRPSENTPKVDLQSSSTMDVVDRSVTNDGDEDSVNTSGSLQFRPYQSEQWDERFQELVEYQQNNGHCLIPVRWKENPALALWVKRQRYQSRLKSEGKHSTLTLARHLALEKLGFLWHSRGVAWDDRFSELKAFQDQHGHCHIPSYYAKNSPLAIWVKCQRRQFKLFVACGKSSMTKERIARLSSIGFVWNPRNRKPSYCH